MKQCSKCGDTKELSCFSKDPSKSDGLYSSCKTCKSVGSRKNYEDRKLRTAAIKSLPENKTCTRCRAIFPSAMFNKGTSSADGLTNWCKTCIFEYSSHYRKANREKVLEKSRAYEEANKDKISKRKSVYYIKNRERILERNAAWEIEAKKTKPLFSLRKVLRNRTAEAFHRGGFSKTSKTADMLGCDWDFFLRHLESQFHEGMSWDNRGEWHMDHIIPLSSAKTEDELIALCHYTNIQPLWAADNLKKGANLE